jgi:hypothetical protein
VGAIDADAATKTLVAQALAANLVYAESVNAAVAKLSTVSANAVENSAQRTKGAYAAVRTHNASVAVPPGSSFLAARQLNVLAAEAAKGESEASASKAAIRGYVQSIDSLLRNSVETRTDLGTLISEVQNGSIGSSEARDRIAGVIAQRTSLETQVAALSTPKPFVAAAELLRQSIAASLDDDRAIQGLINAYLDGSDPSSFLSQHDRANARATAAKRQFLETYNRLRTRYLKLAPLPLDLRY